MKTPGQSNKALRIREEYAFQGECLLIWMEGPHVMMTTIPMQIAG